MNPLHSSEIIRFNFNKLTDKFRTDQGRSFKTPMEEKLNVIKIKGSKLEKSELYQSIVGSLMYACINTRLDIAHAVNVLSRFNLEPNVVHLRLAKRVMKYSSGNPKLGHFCGKLDKSLVN